MVHHLLHYYNNVNTMTKLIAAFIAFIIAPIYLSSQTNGSVYLHWKLHPRDTLVYTTGMTETAEKPANSPASAVNDIVATSPSMRQLQKQLANDPQKREYLTVLSGQSNGVIAVQMNMRYIIDSARHDTDSIIRTLQQIMASLKPSIVLRGAISGTGGIESFYLQTKQKNLLALLFQMPFKSIIAGESWPLDINLIEVDESFRCDSSFRKNLVTCKGIVRRGDETVVTLQYNMEEFIYGEAFGMIGSIPKSFIKIVYAANGEFLVNQGCWQSYDAVMTTTSNGIMLSNTSKKISLRLKGKF
jgi:hypothetical protein